MFFPDIYLINDTNYVLPDVDLDNANVSIVDTVQPKGIHLYLTSDASVLQHRNNCFVYYVFFGKDISFSDDPYILDIIPYDIPDPGYLEKKLLRWLIHIIRDYQFCLYDMSLSSMSDPVFLCDRSYNVCRMNDAAKRLVGDMSAFYNFLSWRDFIFSKITDAKFPDCVYWLHTTSANRYYTLAETRITDFFGTVIGYMYVFTDITYRYTRENMMKEAADIDALTGVYNRRYFDGLVKQSEGGPVSLLYLDLDNFKQVNDTLGHDTGDFVVQQTAKAIQKTFYDSCVVRLGGDEFAVFWNDVLDEDVILQKADLVSQHVRKLVSEVNLGVSFGFSGTRHLDDWETFIRLCDARMYAMKEDSHKRYGGGR